MQGYVNQSPLKQVWLPLDYDWLNQVIDGSVNFKNFAEAYKKQYGIDLHDVLKLNINGSSYSIGSKVDVLSAYSVGKLDGVVDTKASIFNALAIKQQSEQGETSAILAQVAVVTADYNVSANFGHGIYLRLPATSTPVNSIDDIEIVVFEI